MHILELDLPFDLARQARRPRILRILRSRSLIQSFSG